MNEAELGRVDRGIPSLGAVVGEQQREAPFDEVGDDVFAGVRPGGVRLAIASPSRRLVHDRVVYLRHARAEAQHVVRGGKRAAREEVAAEEVRPNDAVFGVLHELVV